MQSVPALRRRAPAEGIERGRGLGGNDARQQVVMIQDVGLVRCKCCSQFHTDPCGDRLAVGPSKADLGNIFKPMVPTVIARKRDALQ